MRHISLTTEQFFSIKQSKKSPPSMLIILSLYLYCAAPDYVPQLQLVLKTITIKSFHHVPDYVATIIRITPNFLTPQTIPTVPQCRQVAHVILSYVLFTIQFFKNLQTISVQVLSNSEATSVVHGNKKKTICGHTLKEFGLQHIPHSLIILWKIETTFISTFSRSYVIIISLME